MRKQTPTGITVLKRPRLSDPCLIAAWPGIANVAITAVRYLIEKTRAKELAEIEPLPFYDINEVSIEDGLIQSLEFPQYKFYYHKDRKHGRDLIIFDGEAQPSYHGYQLANKVLEFAQSYGVTRIYTLAAALVEEFKTQPRVWATATDAPLIDELRNQDLVLKENFYIAGMNGLLLSVAKERNMEGICLLGETPRFSGEIINPFASLAILEALTRILQLDVNLRQLRQVAEQARQEIEKGTLQNYPQFLEQFTFPLWERWEEEEQG